jgi:hypothetical protein
VSLLCWNLQSTINLPCASTDSFESLNIPAFSSNAPNSIFLHLPRQDPDIPVFPAGQEHARLLTKGVVKLPPEFDQDGKSIKLRLIPKFKDLKPLCLVHETRHPKQTAHPNIFFHFVWLIIFNLLLSLLTSSLKQSAASAFISGCPHPGKT